MTTFTKKFEAKIKTADNKLNVKILFLKIANLISGLFLFRSTIINNPNAITAITVSYTHLKQSLNKDAR